MNRVSSEVKILVSRWDRVVAWAVAAAAAGVDAEGSEVMGSVRADGRRGRGGVDAPAAPEAGVGSTVGRANGSALAVAVVADVAADVDALGTNGFHLKNGFKLIFFLACFSGVDFWSPTEPVASLSSSSSSSSSSLELSARGVSLPGVTTSPHRTP